MYFFGIDVHLNSYTVACIDHNLNIIKLDSTDENELLNYADIYRPKVIAIDAPYGLNKGLMNDSVYRDSLSKNLKGHYNKKVAEYELSRRGISLYNTPQDMDEVVGWKSWMKTGIGLYKMLEKKGYIHINQENRKNIHCGTAEVFPHACFTTIAGYILKNKTTEGGIQERVKILEKLGFGEIKLVGSRQNKSDKLDALVASYAAHTIFNGEVTFLGDIIEGQIIVPVAEIRDKYSYVKST